MSNKLKMKRDLIAYLTLLLGASLFLLPCRGESLPYDVRAVCTLETNTGEVYAGWPCRVYGYGEDKVNWWIEVESFTDSVDIQVPQEQPVIGRALQDGGQRWIIPSWGTIEYWVLDGLSLTSSRIAFYRRYTEHRSQVSVEQTYTAISLKRSSLVFHLWRDPG